MTEPSSILCPETHLADLIEQLHDTEDDSSLPSLLARYPTDPRLHFLHGSILASQKRYYEAREAMAQAVSLAPDYAIARFQLGFVEFTSGMLQAAEMTWRPLHELAADHYLRLFAQGLLRLRSDDREGAICDLSHGMTANAENPALNNDVRLLIAELERTSPPAGDEPTSETQMLLRHLAGRGQH